MAWAASWAAAWAAAWAVEQGWSPGLAGQQSSSGVRNTPDRNVAVNETGHVSPP